MNILDGIKVVVEDSESQSVSSANSLPLLYEIRHALQHLLQTGEPTTMDLEAMPFGPSDEEKLLELLGEGEVDARIEALGGSRVWETRYPGVWVVEHKNTADQRMALQIEVTEIPAILRTQKADITEGLESLSEVLATDKL